MLIRLLLLLLCRPAFGQWKIATETEGSPQPAFSQFLWVNHRKSEPSRFGFSGQIRRFDFGRQVNRWEPSVGFSVFFGQKKQNTLSVYGGRTFEGRLADGRILTPVFASIQIWKLRLLQVVDPKYRHAQLPSTVFRKTWVGRGRWWFRAEGLHVGNGVGTAFSLWGGEYRQPLPYGFHFYVAPTGGKVKDNNGIDHLKMVWLGGVR